MTTTHHFSQSGTVTWITSIIVINLASHGLCAEIILNDNVENFNSRLSKHLFPSSSNLTSQSLVYSPFSVYSSLIPFLSLVGPPSRAHLKSVLGLESPDDFLSLSSFGDDVEFFNGIFIHKDVSLPTNMTSCSSVVERFEDAANLTTLINAWISNKTEGAIDKIVADLKKDVKLVVTNAVLFKGKWKTKFHSNSNRPKVFKGLHKGPTQVVMMYQNSIQNYGEFETDSKESFQVLKMGYKENDMHLILVLPANSSHLLSIFHYLKGNNNGKLRETLERLEPLQLDIQLPKMRLRSRVNLKSSLKEIGLDSLFSPLQSNIGLKLKGNDSRSLFIDEFVTESQIEFDEEGTKAAAATASVILPLSAFDPQPFVVDRPFILFLRYQGKWTFFEGIVTDLEGEKATLEEDTRLNINIDKTEGGKKENWWLINPGPPAYLTTNTTDEDEEEINEALFNSSINELVSKYQHPLPKNPHGIRFPNPTTSSTKPKTIPSAANPPLSPTKPIKTMATTNSGKS